MIDAIKPATKIKLTHGRRINHFIQPCRCTFSFVILSLSKDERSKDFFFFEKSKYTTGKQIHVTKNEQTNVMIIVLVITLKYAPATPLIKINGMKITIVLIEEPTIAGNKK